MAKRHSRTGQILTITIGLVSGSAVLFTFAMLTPRMTPVPRVVAAREIRTALLRAGLDAESLAIAGLDVPAVARVVTDARTHLETSTLALLEHDYAAAAANVGRVQQVVQSGKSSGEQQSQLATARIALASQETTLTAARTAFLTAAVAGLDETASSRLAVLRGNAKWSVPIEYKLAQRSEGEWVGIRDGLIANRDLLDGSGVNIADAEAVATAAMLLGANRDAVAAAWNTASE